MLAKFGSLSCRYSLESIIQRLQERRNEIHQPSQKITIYLCDVIGRNVCSNCISSFFSRTSQNCNVNFTTLDFGAGKI